MQKRLVRGIGFSDLGPLPGPEVQVHGGVQVGGIATRVLGHVSMATWRRKRPFHQW